MLLLNTNSSFLVKTYMQFRNIVNPDKERKEGDLASISPLT